jgi:hypothetical protein
VAREFRVRFGAFAFKKAGIEPCQLTMLRPVNGNSVGGRNITPRGDAILAILAFDFFVFNRDTILVYKAYEKKIMGLR